MRQGHDDKNDYNDVNCSKSTTIWYDKADYMNLQVHTAHKTSLTPTHTPPPPPPTQSLLFLLLCHRHIHKFCNSVSQAGGQCCQSIQH